MTLPASGVLSLSDIAVELGVSSTGINLNDGAVRSLAGVATGPISLSDFYAKSASPPVNYTIKFAMPLPNRLTCEPGAPGYSGYLNPQTAYKNVAIQKIQILFSTTTTLTLQVPTNFTFSTLTINGASFAANNAVVTNYDTNKVYSWSAPALSTLTASPTTYAMTLAG